MAFICDNKEKVLAEIKFDDHKLLNYEDGVEGKILFLSISLEVNEAQTLIEKTKAKTVVFYSKNEITLSMLSKFPLRIESCIYRDDYAESHESFIKVAYSFAWCSELLENPIVFVFDESTEYYLGCV